jgi:hypothetical protein
VQICLRCKLRKLRLAFDLTIHWDG